MSAAREYGVSHHDHSVIGHQPARPMSQSKSRRQYCTVGEHSSKAKIKKIKTDAHPACTALRFVVNQTDSEKV
jgi:hypothetical protein